MREDLIEQLGERDIEFSGLLVWVHSRQFPDSLDYWDGNWLNVTAHCGTFGASVQTSGSILHLSEVQHWLETTEKLYNSLSGEAALPCIEPELSISMTAKLLGGIEMSIKITPDHMSQKHEFLFDIDQSYLPELIRQLKSVLARYPIRDPDRRH